MSTLRYDRINFKREDSSKHEESVVFDRALGKFYGVKELVAEESSKEPKFQAAIKVWDEDMGIKYLFTHNEGTVTIVVKDLTEDEKRTVKS